MLGITKMMIGLPNVTISRCCCQHAGAHVIKVCRSQLSQLPVPFSAPSQERAQTNALDPFSAVRKPWTARPSGCLATLYRRQQWSVVMLTAMQHYRHAWHMMCLSGFRNHMSAFVAFVSFFAPDAYTMCRRRHGEDLYPRS